MVSISQLCAGDVATKPAWAVPGFSTNVSALGGLTPNPCGEPAAGEEGGPCELQMVHALGLGSGHVTVWRGQLGDTCPEADVVIRLWTRGLQEL